MSDEQAVSSSGVFEENIDEKIMAQQEAIEKEIAQNQPLVGAMLDVSILRCEYLQDDSIYQRKLDDLSSKYKHLRKTRGDGNCFFRAFSFRYFETLLGQDEEIDKFKNVVRKLNDELLQLGGYSAFTLEDFRDVFLDVLDKLKSSNNMTSEDLRNIFCDQGTSDYLVVYFRLIVSCYLQMNAAFYENFIEGYVAVKDFCSHEVEPMYRESDHIHLIAATQAINVPVRVIYMDRGDQDQVFAHDFPEGSTPNIHILYRPGHYDILYN